jgi:glycosyltransferase involved in cell wall biosynthesis
MRILYCAIDQTVPGTVGGSVHVQAVAEGLAALGHEVRALVTAGPSVPGRAVTWTHLPPPLGRKELRWARAAEVRQAARAFLPDVVIERYYNFGGEGALAARACGAALILEVNAPVIDHPGSRKRLLDRALLLEPMRRWREWQVAQADAIVTPSAEILPKGTPQQKIVRLEWGADTVRFQPRAADTAPRAAGAGTSAVFAGAFRSWHGAIHLVDSFRRLRDRGEGRLSAVFIGDGPELPRVRAAAAGLEDVTFLGAQPHERMPALLAGSDIGVAPFDPGAHGPLALGFYWSPLKIFEYMASGLPVVAPALPRITELVESGREGLLYDPRDPDALANALQALVDPARRAALGRAARARAERDFSWEAHCRALDALVRRLRPSAAAGSGASGESTTYVDGHDRRPAEQAGAGADEGNAR